MVIGESLASLMGCFLNNNLALFFVFRFFRADTKLKFRPKKMRVLNIKYRHEEIVPVTKKLYFGAGC